MYDNFSISRIRWNESYKIITLTNSGFIVHPNAFSIEWRSTSSFSFLNLFNKNFHSSSEPSLIAAQ